MTGLDLDDLKRQVRGVVTLPVDAAYHELRRTFNAMLDRKPAMIVRPLDAADAAAAVRWAARADLPISVRCGGHSVAGHGVGEGSLMLDLAQLRAVTVDPAARLAYVGGGARLEDLDRATTAFDLAAPSGTYADTGIGGIVLGGGLNYLMGSRGFACDGLVGAELVTGDGSIVEVDAERDPELLWALRGGGGNFGVVTRFTLALAPLTSVYGGRISFAGPRMRELTEYLFESQAVAPDEMSMFGALWRDAADGGQGATCFVGWTGDPAAGEAALAPLRRRSDVLADELGPMSYLDLQLLFPRGGPTLRQYWKSQFVGSATGGLVDAIEAAHKAVPTDSIVLIEPIHGMAHRIPAESAAFGAREAKANVAAMATWTDPADDDARIRWARESVASWEPFSLRGGGYLNYSAADETPTRVERSFGSERFARLQAVKRRCDPDNRFRFNANIPPA
jgi:FAD/FMN-containing dehydrogenase